MKSKRSLAESAIRVSLSDEYHARVDHAVAALDKLHAKHVLPGFTDRTAEEREIERQTQDITRVCLLPRVGSHC